MLARQECWCAAVRPVDVERRATLSPDNAANCCEVTTHRRRQQVVHPKRLPPDGLHLDALTAARRELFDLVLSVGGMG